MWVVAEIYFVAFDEELNGKKFNMHHYAFLEDLIHQAIKVEQQLKRKQTYKKERASSFKSHEKVLPLVKIILTLLPLLQKRVPINVLSVWERVILPPNILTKGLWL